MSGDERIANPVEVVIKNWGESVKPPTIKNTTVKTYILDPAGLAGPKNIQICEYEPRRMRCTVAVYDSPVALTLDPPVNSPGTSTASLAPEGLHLGTAYDYDFFGPDNMWINSITAVTRVGVTKEYS